MVQADLARRTTSSNQESAADVADCGQVKSGRVVRRAPVEGRLVNRIGLGLHGWRSCLPHRLRQTDLNATLMS